MEQVKINSFLESNIYLYIAAFESHSMNGVNTMYATRLPAPRCTFVPLEFCSSTVRGPLKRGLISPSLRNLRGRFSAGFISIDSLPAFLVTIVLVLTFIPSPGRNLRSSAASILILYSIRLERLSEVGCLGNDWLISTGKTFVSFAKSAGSYDGNAVRL